MFVMLGIKSNFGFAKAVNRGVSLAQNNYFLFLNPDVFLSKTTIEVMWKFLTKAKYRGITGCKVINGKKKLVQKTVVNPLSLFKVIIEFTSLKKVFHFFGFKNFSRFWNYKVLNAKNVCQVYMISGCFMFCSRDIFDKVGGFDEKFFLYLEDLDFCIRVNKLGYKIFYNPHALVKHIEGESSRSSPYRINEIFWDKSKRYFCKKWFGFSGYVLNYLFDLDDYFVKIKKYFSKVTLCIFLQ